MPRTTHAAAALRDLRLFYRALGDVHRLRAIEILASEGEHTPTELARRVDVSLPLFSWHLRRLTRAGIVRTRRIGREVRCTFDRERFLELQERGSRMLVGEPPR